MDYLHKKTLIIGFGVTGKGALSWCIRNGHSVTVFSDTAIDISDSEYIKYRNSVQFIDRKVDKVTITDFDLVIISPSVTKDHVLYKKAEKYKIPIRLDITIFLELWGNRGPVIGITGSNGKSTTATLLHEALSAAQVPSVLVGNIGMSPLAVLDELVDGTHIVLELSCSQLEHFKKSHGVDIALFTNITPNHLDKYGGCMDIYAHTKRNILHLKTHSVYNLDDRGTLQYILPYIEKNCSTPFSLKTEVSRGVMKKNENLVIKQGKKEKILMTSVSKQKLMGEHNRYNLAGVLTVLNILDVDIQSCEREIRNFSGLEHRIEYITSIGGVQYINDSKSTSPDATIKAFDACASGIKKTVFIAGGSDKCVDYSSWKLKLSRYIRFVILLPGSGTDSIRKVFEDDPTITMYEVDSMNEAVRQSYILSQPGDLVLLSPGTSSRDSFSSFEDRGRQFKQEVFDMQTYNEKVHALRV